MRSMHTGDDRARRARAWRGPRRGGPDPSLPKRDYPTLLSLSTPEGSVEEQMLNHVNFAQWSTPQQATFRTEVLWPLPPLSTIDPRSGRNPREPCHRYETDDSLNAGWDGPPSWNVSAAAMTGDIELLCTAFEVESRAMKIIQLRIIDEIHAHRP